MNENTNPLNYKNGNISVIADKFDKNNNIAHYAQDYLINGKTEEVYKVLKSIRGCGDKISALYLRDIGDELIQTKGILTEKKMRIYTYSNQSILG